MKTQDSFLWALAIVISLGSMCTAAGETAEKPSSFEVVIHEDWPSAIFHVTRAPGSETYWTVNAYWQGDGRSFQEWTVGPQQSAPTGSNYFGLLDMNFDGYQDVRIPSWQGATGNFGYSVWVFEPRKREFVFHEGLSSLQGPRFDHEKEEIHTLSKGGHAGAIYTKGTWKFVDGELVQVEEERQRYVDEEDHYVKVLRKRVDGELREVSRMTVRDGSGEQQE